MNKKVHRKNEIVKSVLKTILIGGFVVSCMIAPGFAMAGPLFGFGKGRKLSRTLKNLKEKKYIKIYDKDKKTYFELTNKGKKKILQFDYEDMVIKKTSKWDGFWRVVVFDISEKRKRSRDEIRFKLTELGFYKYRDSTFVYPYNCKNEINFIKNYNFLSKDIDFLLVKNIERESELKKYFRLK